EADVKAAQRTLDREKLRLAGAKGDQLAQIAVDEATTKLADAQSRQTEANNKVEKTKKERDAKREAYNKIAKKVDDGSKKVRGAPADAGKAAGGGARAGGAGPTATPLRFVEPLFKVIGALAGASGPPATRTGPRPAVAVGVPRYLSSDDSA